MVNILPAAPQEDPMERMIRLFRVGLSVRQQKMQAEQNAEELKLRGQQLMQQAKAEKARSEGVGLEAIIQAWKENNANLAGGPSVVLPQFESEGLSPLSGLSLPTIDAATKAAREGMVSAGKTRGEQERPVSPLETEVLRDRLTKLQIPQELIDKVLPAAGASMDSRGVQTATTILGQSPDVGRANINLPGIAQRGQVISPAEISARVSQQGEAGTASRFQQTMALREKMFEAKTFNPEDPEQRELADSLYEQYRTGQITYSSASRAFGKQGFGAWLVNQAVSGGDVILPEKVRQGMAKMNNAESFVANLGKELDAAHAAGGLTKQKQLFLVDRYVQSAAALLPEAYGDSGRKSDQDIERALKALPGYIMSQNIDLAHDQLNIILRSIDSTRKDILREYSRGYKKPGASKVDTMLDEILKGGK